MKVKLTISEATIDELQSVLDMLDTIEVVAGGEPHKEDTDEPVYEGPFTRS